MNNLWSHKSLYVLKCMQFSDLKKRLSNMIISFKEQVAKEVSEIHGFSKGTIEGFFQKNSLELRYFMNLIKKYYFNKKNLRKDVPS